jgi:acetyl-CoA carboxylase biotin carboxylase subunit
MSARRSKGKNGKKAVSEPGSSARPSSKAAGRGAGKSRSGPGSKTRRAPRTAAPRAGGGPSKPKLLRKVLVANRGEIAIRIFRALSEMGIGSVAVYSEADRLSWHLRYADEAHLIGPPPASESYLDIARIVDVARKAGCDGIHPGYGFLAESHEFAEACEKAGIVFIGPSPVSIRTMGFKTEAKRIMSESGVPVIPGPPGPVTSAALAEEVALEIGYPVMLKASAGGGGKGMRIVGNPAEMRQAFKTATGEARSYFGNPEVFLEKYIEKPRHIEVQILADDFGHTIYLGERECSVQRRYQKLIEESPSPAIDAKARVRIGETAVRAARAAGYRNAGTVEFILDQSGAFYFLEMNTRLQVEHPVTEFVTGIDIVKQQLRIASGFPLEYSQESIRPQGASIECRIYAEDPKNNFLPSLGRITRLKNPEGPWVRVENYVYRGYDVPVYYDPLIAKLITWGIDRESAIARMSRALSEYIIEGIETTIPFHMWVMRDPQFASGTFDTSYIDKHYIGNATRAHRQVPPEVAIIAASIGALESRMPGKRPARENVSRWKEIARREGIGE